ncbi:MAG: hypothetical protein IPG10_09405 [Flavobacteriales bacterium]|nr:hypothetical protein [Flavobacteriales bacterium]
MSRKRGSFSEAKVLAIGLKLMGRDGSLTLSDSGSTKTTPKKFSTHNPAAKQPTA